MNPGPRNDEEAAVFTSAITGRRGRPPTFLLAVVVALMGVVVAGFGGRLADLAQSPVPPGAIASTGASDSAVPSPLATSSEAAVRPAVTSEPGPIVLKARRNGASVYVHGDVLAARVTWIYVALQDARGRVAGWTSVSMPDPGPGSSGAGGGPLLLFDVELAVPADTYPGPIFVFAHAHDADGALVGAAQLELAP